MMTKRPVTRTARLLWKQALLVGFTLSALPPRAALAADPPKLLSRMAVLIEQDTGDAYVRLSPSEPAKFLLTGPGRLQADLRVNLATGAPSAADTVLLSIVLSGKAAGSLRVQPKASANSARWRGETAIRPSQAVGFFIDVEPGPQVCEIKINGGPAGGAALLLVPTETAKRPLAATAPVIAGRVAPPVVASAPTPSPTPTPLTPDTLRGGPVEDAPTYNATFVGAGWASQSEWDAFEDRRAADVLLDYRRSFPERGLVFAATGEGRFGRRRVRLVNDAPDDDPRDVRASRYVLGLAGTWTRGLLRRGVTALEAGAGLGYRLEIHDNVLAPYVVGFAGPALEVTARRGAARAVVGLEPGFPVHDSSPSSLDAGPIEGRLGWHLEARWIVAADAELVVGYRGEAMDRTYSRRSSLGFVTGVSVGF